MAAENAENAEQLTRATTLRTLKAKMKINKRFQIRVRRAPEPLRVFRVLRGHLVVAAIAALPAIANAQDTTRVPTGVELVGRYNVAKRPLVAVRPMSAAAAYGQVASNVTSIIRQDFDFSDRFEIGDVPNALASGNVDYKQWNSLNVWYLVTGTIAASSGGYELKLDLHDVVYGNIKSSATYSLPPATAADFRMAVHRVSDEIVRTISNQAGSAASRIAFIRRAGNIYELVAIDYDGQNAQRITTSPTMIYSPAWSPDGKKIAYAVRNANARVELHERDLATGRVRVISSRPEISYTPAYSPDGSRLAFAVSVGGIVTEINDYDLQQGCCMRRISRGPRNDLNPTYSPDGRRIAFLSDRIGSPHIFMMPAEGGEATMLTPYNTERVKFTAPSWSPSGNEVAFSGQSRGGFQIMIGDVRRPGVAKQVTSSGDNEDPSWAPDGRHIVFSSTGREGSGLYVIDTVTGRRRMVVAGSKLRTPEWSQRR
jgi:TolB protein